MGDVIDVDSHHPLTTDLEPFRRFARSRLRQDDLANEALQEAPLKAVRHVGDLRTSRAGSFIILSRRISTRRPIPAQRLAISTPACGVTDRLPATHVETMCATEG